MLGGFFPRKINLEINHPNQYIKRIAGMGWCRSRESNPRVMGNEPTVRPLKQPIMCEVYGAYTLFSLILNKFNHTKLRLYFRSSLLNLN
jgi:hypothetical protein